MRTQAGVEGSWQHTLYIFLAKLAKIVNLELSCCANLVIPEEACTHILLSQLSKKFGYVMLSARMWTSCIIIKFANKRVNSLYTYIFIL